MINIHYWRSECQNVGHVTANFGRSNIEQIVKINKVMFTKKCELNDTMPGSGIFL